MIDTDRCAACGAGPWATLPGASAPTGACSRSARRRGDVRVLDLRSGQVRRFTGGKPAGVSRLAFTPDRRTLVTSHDDGQLLVWDVARGALRERLRGHDRGDVWGLQISADGRTLYSARRRRARVRVGPRRRSPAHPAASIAGPPFALSATGLRAASRSAPTVAPVAVTQTDGSVESRSTRRRCARAAAACAGRLRRRGRLQPRRAAARDRRRGRAGDAVGRAHAAARGRAEWTVDDVSGTRLLARRQPARRRRARHATITDQPTATCACGTCAGAPHARALRGDRRPHWPSAPTAGCSPPPRATGPSRGPRRTHGRLVARLPRPTRGVRWRSLPTAPGSPPGYMDGTAQLWSTRSWKPVGPRFEGHAAQRFLSMQFTPDGRVLVTAGADGTVRLQDVAHREADRHGPDGRARHVRRRRPRPRRLATVRRLGGVDGVRWDIAPEAWKRHACLVAGRELSAREWSDALPGRPYRAICDGG